MINLAQGKAFRSSEAGFGITLIAITIAMVMGISVATYMRQLSTQALQFQDMYAGSQARWTAMSGLEFGLYKAELGEADISGSYPFFNSTVILDTVESDPAGFVLLNFHYTITSRGTMGTAYRDLRVFSKKSLKTIWGDVSIIEGTGDISIRNTYALHDSIYIGQNVSVQAGTVIGDPPGAATHMYIPPGKSVSGGQEDAYFTTGLHPKEWLFNPDFNTDPYDSLLAIAYAISADDHAPPNNKFSGNERLVNQIINLNIYTDSTIYILGKLTLQGCTITGGDTTRPAVIVATSDIIAESRNGTETTFGDNIVLISNDDIYLYDVTEFGLDHSTLSPENRPRTHNLIYGFDLLEIDDDVVAWASCFSNDDIRLDGSAYGIMYAPDKFTFKNSGGYLEGAVFIHKPVGNGGNNLLDRGSMNLNHYFNQDYFKTFDYGVIKNSLIEF